MASVSRLRAALEVWGFASGSVFEMTAYLQNGNADEKEEGDAPKGRDERPRKLSIATACVRKLAGAWMGAGGCVDEDGAMRGEMVSDAPVGHICAT
jgi:hypothetical protein